MSLGWVTAPKLLFGACVPVCVRLLNVDNDDEYDTDDSLVFYSLTLMVVLHSTISRGVLKMVVMMVVHVADQTDKVSPW